MTVALLVVTDGRRDYITQTIPSALESFQGPLSELWIYDDSGDADHRLWLVEMFPGFHVFWHPDGRQGFGGAVREAWAFLRRRSDAEHIFHLEDDFVFARPVDLTRMADVLDAHPDLVQLALRRQPWNDAERSAGGIVEQHPADYTERTEGAHRWLEHRRFFTTNPSLYRRSLLDEGWPGGGDSEGRFGVGLLVRHPDWRFGFWGARDSGEWVTHIGHERVGIGY